MKERRVEACRIPAYRIKGGFARLRRPLTRPAGMLAARKVS